MRNKKIYLNKKWFKCWNPKKTAFCVFSPFNKNGVIWFHKNYYIVSKFKDHFGVEIPFCKYDTGESLEYKEFFYDENNTVNNYYGEDVFNEYEIKKAIEVKKYKQEIDELNFNNLNHE